MLVDYCQVSRITREAPVSPTNDSDGDGDSNVTVEMIVFRMRPASV